MKTPRFWQSKNLFAALLLPASALYALGCAVRRLFARPVTLPAPVICIGNLTAGGGGKTPLALEIGRRLKERHIEAFFLSRGYGGKARGALRVDPSRHTARDVGDEPLLLARLLPTIVARKRESGARLAVSQGAKAIIMDDGFQNPSLAKTLSLLVLDGEVGLGNGWLLPAGPLRESPRRGLARADAVAVTHPGRLSLKLPENKPILSAALVPVSPPLAGKNLLAFCGLAWPQKFWRTLEEMSAHVVEKHAFADHYFYSETDLQALAARAQSLNARLVTTAKDAVRLPAQWREKILIVELTMVLDDPEALDALLMRAINGA